MYFITVPSSQPQDAVIFFNILSIPIFFFSLIVFSTLIVYFPDQRYPFTNPFGWGATLWKVIKVTECQTGRKPRPSLLPGQRRTPKVSVYVCVCVYACTRARAHAICGVCVWGGVRGWGWCQRVAWDSKVRDRKELVIFFLSSHLFKSLKNTIFLMTAEYEKHQQRDTEKNRETG